MQTTCKVCGRLFIATNPNSKYCSGTCRAEGRQRIRKAWEARTGYIEKKRIQARESRARAAEELQWISFARGKQRQQRFDQDLEEREAEKLSQLRKAAAAGDADARMELATIGEEIDWPSYWSAYRDSEIEYAKNSGRSGERIVNGIPVSDPDFVEKVLAAIEVQGVIFTAFRSGNVAR